MVQVAILWFWRQWKKHAHFWRHIWVEPTIFTRTAWENSSSIEEFSPEKYTIVVCAIFPLDEQTKVLSKILISGYLWYLIIEKPITFSKKLLETLVGRERTIFFIDEAYMDIHMRIGKIYEIETVSYVPDDALSIQEHAIWYTLRSPVWVLSYRDIINSHILSIDQRYLLATDVGTIESVNGAVYLDGRLFSFSFDAVYTYMLYHIADDEMMGKIRSNYLNFRLQSPYWALSYE